MAKQKRRPARFSIPKAVKAMARKRLGQPKPGRVIAERSVKDQRQRKHKETIGELLDRAADE